ncbi:MAG: cob(I)yrinic acid a,c-diamide adenosyltransferase [bacterium]|nr:cob(I)yrinic acid a,c-diamide adenosyltransferase [bacterium]
MKIYTKTGDTGQTGLIGGQRVDKDDPRVDAYGCVDELNAAIGWALVPCSDTQTACALGRIQKDLFVIGAELAGTRESTSPVELPHDAVVQLERWLDEAWSQLPELRNFVLPGGGELASRLHLARTICRRAERTVVGLSRAQDVAAPVIPYLNRLGDLLFTYARLANAREGVEETVWLPPEKTA